MANGRGKMKTLFQSVVALLIAVSLLSCATIIKGPTEDISISSNPSNAQVRVYDRRNVEVWNSTTPTVVELDRGRGYFKGETYTVEISEEGYQTSTIVIRSGINGWYLAGNIVLGGLIGWLIVDPLTGAMYNLKPEDISVGLAQEVGIRAERGEIGLSVVLLEKIPAHVEPKLVPLRISS